ncbi:MAG: PQQ-dependent sugar dehydrogenase [Thermoanaerobaculia bacterium]
MRRSGPRPPFAFAVTALAALAGLSCFAASGPAGLQLAALKLPPGFHIAIFSDQVPGARSMTLGAKGTLFVGTRESPGAVYALRDEDHDGRADKVVTIAKGLRMPNGVAFRDGSLYIAEVSRILRLDRIEEQLDSPPQAVVVTSALPTEEGHGWKFIAFGPDGLLYVPIGAPCNVCKPKERRYAAITRMRPDGGGFEVFAEGIRNTVGFDWHPETKELWFTDNGRDLLSDDTPPDELNRAPRAGLHFGFPFCHGGTISDPEFGAERPCTAFVAPERNLGPHVAALGMRFYRGSMFPAAYRGRILMAEHGSWNRSSKIGYRVMQVRLEGGHAVSYEPFIEGWLQGQSAWGRPVDVLELPDGSVLVSDDKAGAIYRVTYKEAR